MTRYILITGGELFNKGAQSMTFVTINEMKKKFPDHKVLVVSGMDYKREKSEKNKYDFEIIDDIFKYHFAGGIYAKAKKINKESIKKSKEILKNTDLLIDISGYALGSDWSIASTIYFTSKINTASKYGIEVYLMPQSFGPFDYEPSILKPIMKNRVKNSLKKVKIIYAREKEGFDLLQENFSLNNVEVKPDIVLQNKDLDVDNIYREIPNTIIPKIQENSIAIVPNMKNFKHGNEKDVIELYKSAIEFLLEKNKNVYILRHSFEDIKACEIIKSHFSTDERVILLNGDFSCLDLGKIISKFDFIIASRYHSIVHAYKENVPCIALGWATKYHELLQLFGQQKYIYDVRSEIDNVEFIKELNHMNNNFFAEKVKISKQLRVVQKENVFFSI